MTIRVDKYLYSKNVLLKTAYSFTDRYYIHLDSNEKEYVVKIIAKSGQNNPAVQNQFNNELIFQATREMISEQTKTIRELILARSFASTIVVDNQFSSEENDVDTDNVFTDWFDEDESSR